MASSRTIRGVIFQFTPNAVLFEFQEGDEVDGIGVIHPHKIIIGQGKSKRNIPDTATRTEDIAKYIQVGDELDCSVEKKSGLEKVTFKEDEEDVEITPEFCAETATKVGSKDEKTHRILETDEIGEIEGQLDNIFDDDEDDMEKNDDVEIIEVSKENETESRTSRKSRRSSRSPHRRSRTRSRSRDSKKSKNDSGAKSVKKDIKVTLTSVPKVAPRPKSPELPVVHPAKVSWKLEPQRKRNKSISDTPGVLVS